MARSSEYRIPRLKFFGSSYYYYENNHYYRGEDYYEGDTNYLISKQIKVDESNNTITENIIPLL